MLRQVLLLWLSTRQMPTEAKSIGAFLIWMADEQSWRVKRLPVRKVSEFTGYSSETIKTTLEYLRKHSVIVDGEIRKHVISCRLNALHMARSCSIRLAEAGCRNDFDIVSDQLEALSPKLEAQMETVVPFPSRT